MMMMMIIIIIIIIISINTQTDRMQNDASSMNG